MRRGSVEVLIFGTGGIDLLFYQIQHNRLADFFLFLWVAVGATFGWRLAQNSGVRVTTVCRSNFQQVKGQGISLKTAIWGDGSFHPYRVVRTAQEVRNVAFDYVMCE